MGTARVRTVNVVRRLRPGYFHETAIDKRPVAGPVEVDELGLVGDRQIDKSHGGRDRAVYVYADEDAGYWSDELEREIPPGLLGENLRTTGLDVTDALIGERWRIGSVVLEVRQPRTPCQNLSLRMGIEKFHVRFHQSGRVGAMTRVLAPGIVTAGDRIEIVERPDHALSIARLAQGPDAAIMQGLLDSGVALTSSLRAKARRIIARG
jgi:MOSC domain-containing protein YiiM